MCLCSSSWNSTANSSHLPVVLCYLLQSIPLLLFDLLFPRPNFFPSICSTLPLQTLPQIHFFFPLRALPLQQILYVLYIPHRLLTPSASSDLLPFSPSSSQTWPSYSSSASTWSFFPSLILYSNELLHPLRLNHSTMTRGLSSTKISFSRQHPSSFPYIFFRSVPITLTFLRLTPDLFPNINSTSVQSSRPSRTKSADFGPVSEPVAFTFGRGVAREEAQSSGCCGAPDPGGTWVRAARTPGWPCRRAAWPGVARRLARGPRLCRRFASHCGPPNSHRQRPIVLVPFRRLPGEAPARRFAADMSSSRGPF